MPATTAESWTLDGPFVGRPAPLPQRGSPSAIAKEQASGPVRLTGAGLDGDRQADRKVHGGSDRAICQYPGQHYPHWRQLYPDCPVLALPAPFGENVGGDRGPDETELCIGDVLRLGSATLQVSQARAPCWKIEDRTGAPGLTRRVAESGRTGWLCRVLEPGEVPPSPVLTLLERPHPQWTVARAWSVFRGEAEPEARGELGALEPLAAAWRQAIAQRLAYRSRGR